MLYVIDDTANNDEDENRGDCGWMVTLDESGQDEGCVQAYFRTEEAADAYVEWRNSKKV